MIFITDRTYEDAIKAKDYQEIGWKNLSEEERQEWWAGLKGTLNYIDLNRIASNVIEIRDELVKKNTTKINFNGAEVTDISNYDYVYILTDISSVNIYVQYFYSGNENYDYITKLSKNANVVSKGNYDYVRILIYGDENVKNNLTYYGGSNTKFDVELSDMKKLVFNVDWLPIQVIEPIAWNVEILKENLCYATLNDETIISPPPTKLHYEYVNQLEDILRQMHEFATNEFCDIDWQELTDGYETDYISTKYSVKILAPKGTEIIAQGYDKTYDPEGEHIIENGSSVKYISDGNKIRVQGEGGKYLAVKVVDKNHAIKISNIKTDISMAT